MFGKKNGKPVPNKIIQKNSPQGTQQKVSKLNEDNKFFKESYYCNFSVEDLQANFKNFSQVGESVKLWIPKDDALKDDTDDDAPDKVYIYHRDGPGGCLGIVPSIHTGLILYHLKNGLDYEATIEEIKDNDCKIKCKLISKAETEQRKKEGREIIRQELTKPYKPKGPITITLANKKKDVVKAGDKLHIAFRDLDIYLYNPNKNRCSWSLRFMDRNDNQIGLLRNDKNIIKRILKAHFNSYLFDIEVIDTFTEKDFSNEKAHLNWEGYPIKIVIKPYKDDVPETAD